MGIQPNGHFHGKIDLTRTIIERTLEKQVATGYTFAEEGMIASRVLDNGAAAVRPCTAAGEIPLGICLTDSGQILTLPHMQTITIPAGTPYQVALDKQNVVMTPTTSVYVFDVTAGAPMAYDASATPASTKYHLVSTTGIINFHANQASDVVTVQYTYNPTVSEITANFGVRAINNYAQAYWQTVTVGVGYCEVYTTHYDTFQTYAINDQTTLGANGVFTKTGGGTLFGHVISVPTVDDPFLGVAYTTLA